MTQEHQPETFEFYVQGKALVLLYDFHALRFPDAPVHHAKFRLRNNQYLPDGTYHVPEEIMAGHGVALLTKEQEIRRQFIDMLRAGGTMLGRNASRFVRKECEAAYVAFHAEQDLVDASGVPMPCDAILPNSDVIQAMAEDFVVHHRQHCPKLESFIAEF